MTPAEEKAQIARTADRLRTATIVDASTWQRLRSSFAAKAGAEALVDIAYEQHNSPLGLLLIAATSEGLVRVALPAEDQGQVLDRLAAKVSRRILRASREPLTEARRQLDQYFAGTLQNFDLRLDWRLTTGFRRTVLLATAQIPYGKTASYGELAARAGSPAAVRAAGTALATNPLPIIVPCHRVLRSGGALGSYLGGVEMKAQLLTLEGAL